MRQPAARPGADRVVVLGGTGLLGTVVTTLLRERGVEAVPATRTHGVDAYTGAGLDEVFRDARVVVDCLNHQTLSRSGAIDFFTKSATNVTATGAVHGVERLICVSIVNSGDPAVQRLLGYYAGKAAQVDAYRASGMPLTVINSTQWYELAETLLNQVRLGPLSVVPGMRSKPLAVADLAKLVVEHVVAALRDATQDENREEIIAGPQVRDMARLAQAIAARSGRRRFVLRVPTGRTALGSGALLPRGAHTTATTTFEQWLDAQPTERPAGGLT